MRFGSFLKRNREIIAYLIVGVLTTVVSIGAYFALTAAVLNPQKPVQLQTANVISWVAAVSFAYAMSRRFVFQSRNPKMLKEMASFFGARILTLLMDMAMMFLFVTAGGMNDRIAKIIVQVAVIIANYLLSKLVVFRDKNK
ncbi:MAG: GtrA family protein [Clostridia bacterium]|nr:GtrA family protein [Clostridia bacterium]